MKEEDRPENYLRQEFLDELGSRPLRYRLQVQLWQTIKQPRDTTHIHGDSFQNSSHLNDTTADENNMPTEQRNDIQSNLSPESGSLTSDYYSLHSQEKSPDDTESFCEVKVPASDTPREICHPDFDVYDMRMAWDANVCPWEELATITVATPVRGELLAKTNFSLTNHVPSVALASSTSLQDAKSLTEATKKFHGIDADQYQPEEESPLTCFMVTVVSKALHKAASFQNISLTLTGNLLT